MRRLTRVVALAAASAVALPLAACGSGGDGGTGGELTSGPIKVWTSTNEQEIAWTKKVVEAWNGEYPDEKVTAQAIPAGSSSEDVIGAAITAGNTPCLVFNTAPAAVPAFRKQGGLVDLSKTFDDGEKYITGRSGTGADGFRSTDGDLYQLPWKTNPFMLYYNKTVFQKAGLDPEKPQLKTYADVLAAAKAVKDAGAADVAIYPPATSDYTNMLFDFYPFYLANSDGTQFIKDGKATFTNAQGMETLQFWQTLYAQGYSSAEAYSGDMWAGPFADGVAAMGVAGPWGKGQFDGKVEFGVVPMPTAHGKAADATSTFADSKNIGLYTACDNKQTAWDFAKFATNDDNDLALLETTGQFPTRTDVTDLASDYLAQNEFLQPFAASVPLAVDVPTVDGLAEKMQVFRDAWSSAVQSGKGDLNSTFGAAATNIDKISS
ncbi:ABC transporter substrate-binding protein [Mangrovihabitans endophyticus]|uniref:Sugar ABC transporter substrate-binding protein n=1 Tax=Mangrovihabitans endophyticus TaxID=1751298 RepID=A0A8J3C1C3_9ACTN|nr:sugar ABC transporter substrate-binding protein [Mangrovihabitans endophyticus]GGK94978.1 sugar ABC transporter substrate-binding protein [Mangrovihabitans endophyticus]